MREEASTPLSGSLRTPKRLLLVLEIVPHLGEHRRWIHEFYDIRDVGDERLRLVAEPVVDFNEERGVEGAADVKMSW